MKNLHVLPTDHPSRLRYNIKTRIWELNEFHKYHTDIKSTHNIYITSDEVSKGFKVILTTNKLLIKDGIQAIDDDFLEWFIKNSNCEFVETERLGDGKYVNFLPNGDTEEGVYENYKIIIPKEELYNETQQKSLEFNKSLVKSITTEELDLLMSKFDNIEPKQREMFLLNTNTVIDTRRPKQELDCPYNFTSRCTIGRCDCKSKEVVEKTTKMYSEDEVKTIINDIVEKHCAYFKQETKDVVKLEWFDKIKKK